MPLILQQRAEIAAPKTRPELDALVMRRSELQGQLRAAETRRADLANQGDFSNDRQSVVGRRIGTLDERIQRLETDIGRLDEAISQGLANPAIVAEGAAQGIAVPPPPQPPSIIHEPGEAITILPPPASQQGVHPEFVVTGVFVSLALMLVIARVTWVRAKRRFSTLHGAATAGEDVSRLQQSVDTIALEVERISEHQRFLTKLLGERAPERVSGTRPETRYRTPPQ
jgi:hypothetical protein